MSNIKGVKEMFHLLAETLSDPYSMSYTTSTTGTDSGVSAGLIIGLVVLGIILYLVSSFIVGKVFVKAGRPMWAAFVPVYSSWVMLEMGSQKGAWALLALASPIPVLGFIANIVLLVFIILASLKIAERFGKSTVFAVFGLIIFSLVGYIILAFDKSTWNGAPAVAQNSGTAPVAPGSAEPYATQSPQYNGPDNTPPSSPQPPTNVVQG